MSTDDIPRPAAPSAAEREAVLSALGDAYAADRLELDELEQRMARVYRATTRQALAEVLADLQPRGLEGPASAPMRPTSSYADSNPAQLPAYLSARALEYGAAVRARPDVVPARQALMAVMGAAERKGAWVVPSQLRVVSVMGGVTLDLREAQFGPGVTEIELFVLMGGVDIYVPTGVRVECTGMGIMGAFEIASADADPGPDAPVIRLSGVATMGAVDARLKKLKRR